MLHGQPVTPTTQPAPLLVPTDKGFSKQAVADLYRRGEQRVYTGAARKTIGMPCGGICAGQLYVRGDGTLASWQIDGGTYFGDTGQTSYDTYRPPQPIAQGFALWASTIRGASRVPLSDDGFDAIEFVGEYPLAKLRYRDTRDRTRGQLVDVEVFSPFVPLHAQDSAWPATALRFTVRNTTEAPVRVQLEGWLQNGVFREFAAPFTIRHRNRTVVADGLTGVQMDAVEQRPPAPATPVTRMLADFESGTYQGWTVTGAAFGTAPATGTLPDQQDVSGFHGRYLVNSFNSGDSPTGKLVGDPFEIDQPYLTFLIGGGAHAGKTCLNLVVGGDVVRTATGRNNEKLELRVWDVLEFVGRQAHLEIIDAESGGWGHINVDDIALTNVLPAEYGEYNEKGLGFGTMALTFIGDGEATARWAEPRKGPVDAGPISNPPVAEAEAGGGESLLGGVKTPIVNLGAGEAATFTFIVSWHFPNLHTGHGRMYTNWFKDAGDVAAQLAKNLDRLHTETVRFRDSYYRDTTLPWWLASRLMMPVSTLATGTAQWWKDGRFWAWEGAYCCAGTCTHVWNYAQADAWLFPELARSTRTMQDLGQAFDETSGLVGFRSDRNFAADGQAGTVLKCYREHLTSPDDRFLRKHWSRIKAALEYLISQDGDDNGIIENDRQHNTYDINFVGPNTFVGALYLAALRAGEEMARDMKDAAAAQRYRALFESGQRWTVENLFNGEYFEQRVPPGDERPWQYGTGCLSDQLFGQNWAHTLDLGYVYPPEKVRSALATVFKYNWAPDVGPLNAKYPPERWFARPGEPGLFICTWPRGGRPAEPVRYRDEVWTGIEYQVAAGLAWEGMTDEALLIVHGVDERYDGTKHNPWNEVECGDHYARALASWGVLHALAGFTFDGPAGRLALAPRIQKDDFKCFFCAGTGWGNVVQQRRDGTQLNAIALQAGTLRLRHFVTEVPAGMDVKSAAANLLSGTDPQTKAGSWSPTFSQHDGRCEVEFDQPIDVQAGQRLEIQLR